MKQRTFWLSAMVYRVDRSKTISQWTAWREGPWPSKAFVYAKKMLFLCGYDEKRHYFCSYTYYI